MDEAEKKKLWEEYAKEKTPEIRERLILEWPVGLVCILAIMWNMMIW